MYCNVAANGVHLIMSSPFLTLLHAIFHKTMTLESCLTAAVDNLLRTNAGLSPEGGGPNAAADYYTDEIEYLNEPDMPAFGAGLALQYAPPGAVWDYSNVGFHQAALALR